MVVEVAPQARNGNPADDNDSHSKADLLEGIDDGRVEVEGVVVVDSTGVVGGEGERFHFNRVQSWSSCSFHSRPGELGLGRGISSASRNADDEVETLGLPPPTTKIGRAHV